jgi:hypothetical protein
MPKKNKNKNKGNIRNVIDNRNVWIEVSSSSTNINLLLQSDNGEGVYTIIEGIKEEGIKEKYDYEYHTKTEFIEKRICPFCNPTSNIDHKVCKECEEHVIKHTINSEQICQYIEDHNCNCEYCQILKAT